MLTAHPCFVLSIRRWCKTLIVYGCGKLVVADEEKKSEGKMQGLILALCATYFVLVSRAYRPSINFLGGISVSE
jgi:hypothetical protein